MRTRAEQRIVPVKKIQSASQSLLFTDDFKTAACTAWIPVREIQRSRANRLRREVSGAPPQRIPRDCSDSTFSESQRWRRSQFFRRRRGENPVCLLHGAGAMFHFPGKVRRGRSDPGGTGHPGLHAQITGLKDSSNICLFYFLHNSIPSGLIPLISSVIILYPKNRKRLEQTVFLIAQSV